MLGVQSGTVKSRISRGRERLRKKLVALGNILPETASNETKGG